MRTLTAAAVLVAAVQAASPAGCTPLPNACTLSFQGIYIDAGEVWDVVTVACDPRPVELYTEAWMEYKPFDEYGSYGPHVATRNIPGKTSLQLKVRSPCVEGSYRAKVHVEGRGPATTADPGGIPFEDERTGWSEYITAEQCEGGD
ncbi:MAG: hypothetical protein ACT4NY_29305 [Pseudonocardiales bacterium]